jgi:hypothetical protein
MRLISLAVAAILAVVLSIWLELSPKGIAAISLFCIIVCLGLGELIRLIWFRKSKDENKDTSGSGGD